MKTTKRKKGLYDSSITRVWPVFQTLIHKDPSALSWLQNILKLAGDKSQSSIQLKMDFTPLLPEILQKREIGPRVLKYYGLNSIEMERCFEKTIPPADGFLRWLILNPDKMTWPRRGKQTYSFNAQIKREQLFGMHGNEAAEFAQRETMGELDRLGAQRAHGKWWSFEGITQVDCYLETENLILLIEGKRTETLSSKTDWYPQRNQLIRNLEVVQEISGGKYFAVLVIAEEDIGEIPEDVIQQSLPHFTKPECDALMQHYLGCILWKDVCSATGISYDSLPDTVVDYTNQIPW